MMKMIGCTVVVSVSTSYSRHDILTQSSLSPRYILMYSASWTLYGHPLVMYIQRRYNPVSLHFTTFNSSLNTSSSLCLSYNMSSSLRSLQRQPKKLNSFSCEQHHNMILKNLNIFSQNFRKNNLLINTILEVNQSFDIIFIQKLLQTTLRTIPSSKNCKGIPNHPN